MLSPRKTLTAKGCVKGWYYIDRRRIDVLVPPRGSDAAGIQLSRRQLEQALQIMDLVDSLDPASEG
jgi:hypothetical protein